MALAGRVSEEIFFGEDAVGSGASDDFRKVCLPKDFADLGYILGYDVRHNMGNEQESWTCVLCDVTR
jgi:hypothetical protein